MTGPEDFDIIDSGVDDLFDNYETEEYDDEEDYASDVDQDEDEYDGYSDELE